MSPADHETEDFEVRDLIKEAAARRAARFKICDRCGRTFKTEITQKRLDNHYDHPACMAAYRTRRLTDAGYAVITESSIVHRAMQAAGIAARREPTEFEKARGAAWGDRTHSHRMRIKEQLWGPKWITKLLENTYAITRGFDTDDSVPMLGLFIKELQTDREKREGAFATLRLSGPGALHGLIFTRAFRAKKLRLQAAQKMEEALALEKQANELDPPPEPSHAAGCDCRACYELRF